jgi:hypothetical protein
MSITIENGITIGPGIDIDSSLAPLTIATNAGGGLDSGYNNNTLVAAYNAAILTFPVGCTITFYDGAVGTTTEFADYGATIDIGWTPPKTGTLFPITLST